MGYERRKNEMKGLPTPWSEGGRYGHMSGRRKCVGRARSGGRRSMHRAEAGWRSQMLTSSTFGIEDLGPRTKEGLGQAGRGAMEGGRMGQLDLLSVLLCEGRAQPSGLSGRWCYVRFSTGKKERLARILFLAENGQWIE
jgi:hypothetical protein